VDPAKLLREEPWIFIDICGEKNLSVVDVGIAFGAFTTENRALHPPTCVNREYTREPRTFTDYTQEPPEDADTTDN
jgi:hypothetical protein